MKIFVNLLLIGLSLGCGHSFAKGMISYGPDFGHYDEPLSYKSPDMFGLWFNGRYEGEGSLVGQMSVNWNQGRAHNSDPSPKESSYGDTQRIEGQVVAGWRIRLPLEGLSVVPAIGYYAYHQSISSMRTFEKGDNRSSVRRSGRFDQGPVLNLRAISFGAQADYQISPSWTVSPHLKYFVPTEASLRRAYLNSSDDTDSETLNLSRSSYYVYGITAEYRYLENLGINGGVELSDRTFKIKENSIQPIYGGRTVELSYQKVLLGLSHYF